MLQLPRPVERRQEAVLLEPPQDAVLLEPPQDAVLLEPLQAVLLEPPRAVERPQDRSPVNLFNHWSSFLRPGGSRLLCA
jgi:hypothetical protein